MSDVDARDTMGWADVRSLNWCGEGLGSVVESKFFGSKCKNGSISLPMGTYFIFLYSAYYGDIKLKYVYLI
jgi:hypothetical protein